jgi:alkaline phosphatase D
LRAYETTVPNMKYHNARRGYVRCELTPDLWTSDYRMVPYVTRPGAPVETAATYVVENGKPGAERA